MARAGLADAARVARWTHAALRPGREGAGSGGKGAGSEGKGAGSEGKGAGWRRGAVSAARAPSARRPPTGPPPSWG